MSTTKTSPNDGMDREPAFATASRASIEGAGGPPRASGRTATGEALSRGSDSRTVPSVIRLMHVELPPHDSDASVASSSHPAWYDKFAKTEKADSFWQLAPQLGSANIPRTAILPVLPNAPIHADGLPLSP